ncbi:MAG: DUF3194 domain-containing protein, partial [Candidatus Bathyarchaeia archaeon]
AIAVNAVPYLDERPISSLTYEELERICEVAEEAARKYIFSRVKKEYISDLYISVDLEGLDVLNVNVEVEIEFSPLCRKVNAKEIADGSVKAAFEAIENHLKKIRGQKVSKSEEST